MTASIHSIAPSVPEFLLPLFHAPVGGPVCFDFTDFEKVMDDLRTATDFARAQHINILSASFDRNGAYLFVVASPHLYKLFGDECGWVRDATENGLRIQFWLGCIGHIRVFWREVKCAA